MMRMRIFNANLKLAIPDLLMVVEAVVSGYGGGDGDSQKVVRPALEAEHLEADEEGAKGAVSDAAEEAAHSDGSGEAAGNAHERPDDGAEGGTYEERGNNFASFEACGDGDGCKQNLQ